MALFVMAGETVADRVLNEVKKQMKKSAGVCSVSRYSNGRENGYHIVFNGRAVSFAEFRNSDDIVVYADLENRFDACIPSDETYKSKRFFDYGDHYSVAVFIKRFLCKEA